MPLRTEESSRLTRGAAADRLVGRLILRGTIAGSSVVKLRAALRRPRLIA